MRVLCKGGYGDGVNYFSVDVAAQFKFILICSFDSIVLFFLAQALRVACDIYMHKGKSVKLHFFYSFFHLYMVHVLSANFFQTTVLQPATV